MKKLLALAVWCILGSSGSVWADDFQTIKANLSQPGCQYFEFLSIVHSNVFDDVDTAEGTAYIASDGRYSIRIADDQYLCDGEHRYSYNVGSNQVIIEPAGDASKTSEEFYFIVKLDDLYQTLTVESNRRYHLRKLEDAGSEYPDSMTVAIDVEGKKLEQIEFYDVNEDLNIIHFIRQEYFEHIDSSVFRADFPDSVEKVKL